MGGFFSEEGRPRRSSPGGKILIASLVVSSEQLNVTLPKLHADTKISVGFALRYTINI